MPQNSILPEAIKHRFSREITFIRSCAHSGNIKISNHCYEQMSERNIRVKDVYNSIKNGVILEVQTNERDTKILFQDCSNQPPYFFVSVAVKPSMGLCVTAYLPDSSIWHLESNTQWRRK